MEAEARVRAGSVENRIADDDMTNAERAPRWADAYRRMVEEPYRFSFNQVLRLLERRFPDAPGPGETSDVREERIRIRPAAGLTFPPADVKAVRVGDERAEVEVTFLGLYGIGSPLPEFFRERVAGHPEDDDALRDFLDLFNHRFYSFYYRAWKKYRGGIDAVERRSDEMRLLAPAGLATPGALANAPLPAGVLAAFAGRLASPSRNAEGLRQIVGGALGIPVDVQENVPQWVPIRTRSALGSGFTLGDAATMGRRVYDEAGKFRVALGPMSLPDFVAFLPGGERARQLQWLVSLYAPDHLAYDADLLLRTEEIPPLRLGRADNRLGLTTFLGRPRAPVVRRRVDYTHPTAPAS